MSDAVMKIIEETKYAKLRRLVTLIIKLIDTKEGTMTWVVELNDAVEEFVKTYGRNVL